MPESSNFTASGISHVSTFFSKLILFCLSAAAPDANLPNQFSSSHEKKNVLKWSMFR